MDWNLWHTAQVIKYWSWCMKATNFTNQVARVKLVFQFGNYDATGYLAIIGANARALRYSVGHIRWCYHSENSIWLQYQH